jgi:hypothetical protein
MKQKQTRKYKNLIIPDRTLRTDKDIDEKQTSYCNKSDCGTKCDNKCLFHSTNLKEFTEWYLKKNERGKG